MNWSEATVEERIKAVKTAIDAGKSHKQIALEFSGATKSAISGFAYRNGIKSTPVAQRPKPVAVKSAPTGKRSRKEPDIEPLTTMGALEPHQCNWIRAEDQTDGLNTPMCGRDRGESKWCSYHMKRGTRLIAQVDPE